MKQLFLEDMSDYTEQQILEHFTGEYQADAFEVEKFRVLIAYESVGDYGCDSSSWFLLQEKSTGDLYEVHGSHCSCYGFEGQFTPEKTSVEYLKSPYTGLAFCCGGYDNNPTGNDKMIKEYLDQM